MRERDVEKEVEEGMWGYTCLSDFVLAEQVKFIHTLATYPVCAHLFVLFRSMKRGTSQSLTIRFYETGVITPQMVYFVAVWGYTPCSMVNADVGHILFLYK